MIPDPLVDPFGRFVSSKEASDPASWSGSQPAPSPDETDDQAFRALIARFPLLDDALAADARDDETDSPDRVARTLERLAQHARWERVFDAEADIDRDPAAADLERLRQATRGLNLIWDHLGDAGESPDDSLDPAEIVSLPPWMRADSAERGEGRNVEDEPASRADLTLRTLERIVLADQPQAADRLLETVLTRGGPAPILAGPGAFVTPPASVTEWRSQPLQARVERGVAWLLDDGAEFEPPRDLARRTLARLDRRLVVGPFTETQGRPVVSWRDGWIAAALVALAVLATLPTLVRARDEARGLQQRDHLRSVGIDLLRFEAATGRPVTGPSAWESRPPDGTNR